MVKEDQKGWDAAFGEGKAERDVIKDFKVMRWWIS